MSELKMPSLGADMEAGTLVEWIKRPGERVQRGDAVAAVETQKGAIEIESFDSGVLQEIRVEIGQRVPVGTVLAIIRGEGEGEAVHEPEARSPVPLAEVPAPPPPVIETAPPPLPAAEPAKPLRPPAPATTPATWPAAKITPAAMRRALELGVDLGAVQAPADGVIGLREVEAAARAAPLKPTPRGASPPIPPPSVTARSGIDLDEMRRAIAAAMARSWRDIPHYFVSSTLDLSAMLAWLERDNAQRAMPDRLHYAAPLIKAVALALKATPVLNGIHGEHGFEPAAQVNLGIAIAMRGGGLIAPAILDADTRDLHNLMAQLNDLVARVRGGRLRSSELMAPTATLTNLGEGTADSVQPVIYPPQVAIIGCGQIVERAWAREAAISARRTMTVSVGADHRVSDGRSAAKFLTRLDELLQHPERL